MAIAAGALVVAVVARRVSKTPAAAAASAQPSFVCPMHPEVTSSSPGDCPICRMALEPIANVATASEPAALQLATVSQELRAFDAVSRVKRFETSQEMRFAAWAEHRDAGIALVYRDQAKLLVPGETGTVLVADWHPARASRCASATSRPSLGTDRPCASGSTPRPA